MHFAFLDLLFHGSDLVFSEGDLPLEFIEADRSLIQNCALLVVFVHQVGLHLREHLIHFQAGLVTPPHLVVHIHDLPVLTVTLGFNLLLFMHRLGQPHFSLLQIDLQVFDFRVGDLESMARLLELAVIIGSEVGGARPLVGQPVSGEPALVGVQIVSIFNVASHNLNL